MARFPIQVFLHSLCPLEEVISYESFSSSAASKEVRRGNVPSHSSSSFFVFFSSSCFLALFSLVLTYLPMQGKEIRITALLVLDTIFLLLEAGVGYTVQSLALVADAFHMLNDIISLVVALWAVRVKKLKPADGSYTYGWQRAEILGALINAVFLLALCFTIIIEAINRFFNPPEISSPKLVLAVGFAGLISNFVGLVLFHEHGHSHGGGGHSHGGSGHSHSHEVDEEETVGGEETPTSNISDFFPDNVVERFNERSPLVNKDSHNHQPQKQKKKKSMNMEGVFLHVLGDALGNVGVIITALFIWKTDYSWRFYSDPLVSLVITAIIFSSALPLCRKSCKILLQATPPSLDPNVIAEEITVLPTIKSIHDFHIWNLNEDFMVASLHLELNESPETGVQDPKGEGIINKNAFVETVAQVRRLLHKYGIDSVTIQPEFPRQIQRQSSTLYGTAKTSASCA